MESKPSATCSGSTSELEDDFKVMDYSESLESSKNSVSSVIHPNMDQATKNGVKIEGRPIMPKNVSNNIRKLIKELNTPTDEKTLLEMDFHPNMIDNWEGIKQPKKPALLGLLRNMIKNYIKPNVQVQIGEVKFNCHMMVLQCYSDVFMECSNETVVVLPTEKITPKAFLMVYDWMLSEEPVLQREGLLEIFNAANFLKIKGLVEQCWVCLDDDIRFREDTAFLLYLEARNYGLEILQELMLSRVCKFFLTLVASKDFLLLSLKEVCDLLNSNSIGVNCELEILLSGIRWLNYDWTKRQCHVQEIINCVRFSLMPPWILVALGRTSCEDVTKVIDNPKAKQMIADGISYTTTMMFQNRNPEYVLEYMKQNNLTKPVDRMWIFDQECAFHHKPDCPNRLYVSYKTFIEYLETIRTKGQDHWKTLCIAQKDGPNFQCCPVKDDNSYDLLNACQR